MPPIALRPGFQTVWRLAGMMVVVTCTCAATGARFVKDKNTAVTSAKHRFRDSKADDVTDKIGGALRVPCDICFEADTGGHSAVLQLDPRDRRSNICRLPNGGIVFCGLNQLLEIVAQGLT